jgi:signal transduction histidine kinase
VSTGRGRFLRDARDAVVVLRLLVLAGLAMLGLGEAPKHSTPFWFTIIVYGLTNFGYMASGAARFLSPRIQRVVFLFDVLVVSALIVLRGANVPEFILAYFTLVLMAAVVQGIGHAAVNAVVVCAVFAAVSLWGADPRSLLEFPILAQFAFFFVVSVFMSQLAEWGREQQRERARGEEERRRLEATIEDRTRDLSQSVEELASVRRRLAASDRLATIGTLAAGVAHDIRNPVAALRAALDDATSLLEEVGADARGGKDSPGALLRSAVEDATAACEHLQRLANDLTAVARATPATPVAVPCLQAVDAAARLLRHRAKPPLSIEVRCTTEAAAMADPGRLQQVLLNLGANALDAMEGRAGVLTLSAEAGEAGHVRFRVSDTGIGMRASTAAKVLAGFFTTKEAGKGTGLGLHLVREIAEAHGARINLVSEWGSGTTFLIEWPEAVRPRPEGDDHDRTRGRTGDGAEDAAADRGRRGEHSPRPRANAPS